MGTSHRNSSLGDRFCSLRHPLVSVHGRYQCDAVRRAEVRTKRIFHRGVTDPFGYDGFHHPQGILSSLSERDRLFGWEWPGDGHSPFPTPRASIFPPAKREKLKKFKLRVE